MQYLIDYLNKYYDLRSMNNCLKFDKEDYDIWLSAQSSFIDLTKNSSIPTHLRLIKFNKNQRIYEKMSLPIKIKLLKKVKYQTKVLNFLKKHDISEEDLKTKIEEEILKRL